MVKHHGQILSPLRQFLTWESYAPGADIARALREVTRVQHSERRSTYLAAAGLGFGVWGLGFGGWG